MRRNCSSFTALLALAGACADPKPAGHFQKDDTCYHCRPVGGANSVCVVADAAVCRTEDDATNDSGMDNESFVMDGRSPDVADASDGAVGAQDDGAPASDAATSSAVGSSEGDAHAGDSGAASEGNDDAETTGRCPAGMADGGTSCQLDPCDPNPCGAGFTCNRTPSGTASCMLSCASGEPGCQPGDPCSTDAECGSGGDRGASCDPMGKVCVTVCPTTSIVSESHLEAAKFCREIDGDPSSAN